MRGCHLLYSYVALLMSSNNNNKRHIICPHRLRCHFTGCFFNYDWYHNLYPYLKNKGSGILRSIGAKKDIARVFNAETSIVGFGRANRHRLYTAVTSSLTLYYTIFRYQYFKCQLPVNGAIVLIIISIILTFIAGLIPSGIAARKILGGAASR